MLKKLQEPLDNYKYFVNHFDNVINFLKETKTNSGFHIYCIAISKIIPYLDNISENKKQEYKQQYLQISNEANKIVKNKNKPIIKKEIKNVLKDETQYVAEENNPISEPENKTETRKSTCVLEQKENKEKIEQKQQKQVESPKLKIIQTKKTTSIEDEIDQILEKVKLRNVTKKNYRHKILQLISEYNKNAQDLDFLVLDVDNC